MKKTLLSAIALTTASITTQAATPVDGLEYYIGASLGWHALSDKKTAVSPVTVSGLETSSTGTGVEVDTSAKAVLDDKRQMDFAGFIGARKFFDQGFFVGFEGRFSKTRKEFTTSTTVQAQKESSSILATIIATGPATDGQMSPNYTNTVTYKNHFKNSYSVAAIVPVGMRFDIDNDMSVDVYGILGYQYSKYKVSTSNSAGEDTNKTPFSTTNTLVTTGDTANDSFNLSGFQYGVGFDVNMQEFKIGARYVINKLDSDKTTNKLKKANLLGKDTKDNTFSVNLSYVF